MARTSCNAPLESPKFPTNTFEDIRATCKVEGARHSTTPHGLLTVTACCPPRKEIQPAKQSALLHPRPHHKFIEAYADTSAKVLQSLTVAVRRRLIDLRLASRRQDPLRYINIG